jgi:hypothetical protein
MLRLPQYVAGGFRGNRARKRTGKNTVKPRTVGARSADILASIRKAYYLMAIHENLTRIPKPQLREVGWSKAVELVKVARRDGENFDCATWLHKAKGMPKEGFKGEVERHLTGKDTEPWEIIYFKLYKSQLPIVEKAIETAALMLGSDKSRGYCLEMICADFLAGANAREGES